MTDFAGKQEIIAEFERLISTPRSMKADIQSRQADTGAPAPQNKIKQKGLQSQEKGRRKQVSKPKTVQHAVSTREHPIHQMLVKHPFLLHTPELFAGGLYLDSVINKLPLPCHLVPDFAYITVQGTVVKITLVEIERAVKGVFNQKFGMRSTFRSETLQAIDQVREWQQRMESSIMRHALLSNLSPLFERYPATIFEKDGSVSRLIEIKLGYVLVVGNESIVNEVHQRMVDDLYLHEGIIFLTYPMMIQQLRREAVDKNMLKVGARRICVETLNAPDQLLRKGPDLGFTRPPDDDPLSVKMAGLGWPMPLNRRSTSCHHPGAVQAVFYRAQGRCEIPECTNRIIQNGQVCGSLKPLYNGIDDDSDYESIMDVDNALLVCDAHKPIFNRDEVYFLGKPHPLAMSLKIRRPYRACDDADAVSYVAYCVKGTSEPFLKELDISPTTDPVLAADVDYWYLAVVSLPSQCQKVLAKIVSDCLDDDWKARRHRPKHRSFDPQVIRYLCDARLITITEGNLPYPSVYPNVFSPGFIRRLRETYGDRTMQAIDAVCAGSAYCLSQIERVENPENEPVLH